MTREGREEDREYLALAKRLAHLEAENTALKAEQRADGQAIDLLRGQKHQAEAGRDALHADLAKARAYIEADKDAHCLPTCDSRGHDANCPYVDAVEHFAQVKADLARARAVLETVVECGAHPFSDSLYLIGIDRAAWQAWREGKP